MQKSEDTENINTQNIAKKAQVLKEEKKADYDPIMDDPIESQSSEKSETSEESEEEVDIQFPRDNSNDLLTFLHRDIQNMQNLEDAQKRKFALIRLYQIFVIAKDKASPKVY